ncbi:MAG: PilZ domain-containing protein [Candidatus Omnitrophota bacterium]|nr:PilZ domain-containing protein [Candidatus Omnitrophota bacterium]
MAEDQDKRKYLRIDATYVVSYCAKKVSPYYNISQTRNISQGGAVFTTNKVFSKGMILTMTMKFPFLIGKKIEVQAQVMDSKKLGGDIYNTRVKFLDLDPEVFKKFGEFIKQNKDAKSE